jgi:hypothetical protein
MKNPPIQNYQKTTFGAPSILQNLDAKNYIIGNFGTLLKILGHK